MRTKESGKGALVRQSVTTALPEVEAGRWGAERQVMSFRPQVPPPPLR